MLHVLKNKNGIITSYNDRNAWSNKIKHVRQLNSRECYTESHKKIGALQNTQFVVS